MLRRSARISSAPERLGSTSPESKQNDVNHEIKSHPLFNKRGRLEIEEHAEKQVVEIIEKQVQEVEEHYAKQVEEYRKAG